MKHDELAHACLATVLNSITMDEGVMEFDFDSFASEVLRKFDIEINNLKGFAAVYTILKEHRGPEASFRIAFEIFCAVYHTHGEDISPYITRPH